jgi:hypothetical protein
MTLGATLMTLGTSLLRDEKRSEAPYSMFLKVEFLFLCHLKLLEKNAPAYFWRQ